MNSYKLNGMAGHYFRMTVSKFLGIHWNDIYKTVDIIESTQQKPCVITTKDGKKYELILKEL
jgi:exopolysaccharide biosynthesis protein